jgi:hypothetical protein
MPRPPKGRKVGDTFDNKKVADAIWGLHSVLVDPASTPAETKGARDQMLRILGVTKVLGIPRLVIPPLRPQPGPGGEPSEYGPRSRRPAASWRPRNKLNNRRGRESTPSFTL